MTTRAIRLRSRLPLVLIAVLLFLQVFSPTRATKFVLFALIGTVVVAYVWVRLMTRGLVIKRERRHEWAQVGDVLEERFIMHNHSWVPVPWAEVRDLGNLPGYNASRAVGLPTKRFTRWQKRCVCTQRGVFTLGPMDILMGDPFGLFQVTVRHNYSETFVVYPAIAALPTLLEPQGMSRGSSRANLRSLSRTTNASSVRTYVPGDALSHIHWRITAHRDYPGQDHLYVHEFDIEPSGDVWILLDLDAHVQRGKGLVSTEEYAVILAASLADRLLSANHAVGLVTYGEEPVVLWPHKGRYQLWQILRVLAGTHAEGDRPFSQLLKQTEPIVRRGVSAALITPSTDPQWVAAVPALLMRGVHGTVMLLDASDFGEAESPARTVHALMDAGVRVHLIDRKLKLEETGRRRAEDTDRRDQATRKPPRGEALRRPSTQWVPARQGQNR